MRHEYECRVRWSDVDAYGHVNNVKYFEYYQEARIAFVTDVAGGRTRDSAGSEGFVVARLVVDYKRPILFRLEPFTIQTWVTRVGRSSYDLAAVILDGDQVLSSATAVLVGFDRRTKSSRRLSESERIGLATAVEG